MSPVSVLNQRLAPYCGLAGGSDETHIPKSPWQVDGTLKDRKISGSSDPNRPPPITLSQTPGSSQNPPPRGFKGRQTWVGAHVLALTHLMTLDSFFTLLYSCPLTRKVAGKATPVVGLL